MKNQKQSAQLQPPIKTKWLIRILLLVIICLAFLAAYYQSALKLEIKKYKKLENNYVRVRDMLGQEETQKLIDQSYKQENSN